MNTMELNGLTKYYGKARGIEDVSFSVGEGEIFGFIGPNGAGKSTTIRTLLALMRPTRGTATIFGKDILRDAAEIRREVGYLPSEVFYYDDMRVIDLLKYSASFYKKDCGKRIEQLSAALELDLKKRITDLSFGNRKKVGIVQGLIHEPKLIILDEPTSGLDPLMQRTFFDLIAAENKRGATVLFSSHILSEVQRLCHRVAIIKQGKIVDVQTIEQLRSSNCKRVKVEMDGAFDPKLFAMEGISDLTNGGRQVSFLLRGDINPLVRALGQVHVVNLDISEPDLEEVFMHYYEQDAPQKEAERA